MQSTVDGFRTSDDTDQLGRVAQRVNELAPTAAAQLWHGGGIFGVLLKQDDGREAFFGTADDEWAGDLMDNDGGFLDAIPVGICADEPDADKIASELIAAVRPLQGAG